MAPAQIKATPPPRPPGRRFGWLPVLAVVVMVGAIVAYLRLMVDFTARPVVPHQVVAPAVATLTVAEQTVPRGAFDFPNDGSTVVGETQVRGWAVDAGSDAGAGVDRVRLFLDGTYLQDAEYGQARPDIGTVFGTGYVNSGWMAQLDLRQQPFGSHHLEARAHSIATDQETSYTSTIVLAPRPSAPRGTIDAPSTGEVVSGVTEVRGWALDETAEQGTGVDRVDLYVDDALLTEAAIGQPRPDISAGYGGRFDRAGWHAQVDLRGVAPGPHQVVAKVHSTVVDQDTSYSVAIMVGQ